MIKIREGENIRLIKRRHKLVLIKNLAGLSFVFLTIIGLMIALFFVSLDFPETMVEIFPFLIDYNTRILGLYLLSLTLLVLWQSVFVVIANYYLDCWIVTDERTIHTELRALFSRIFSSISHHRVQDVTVDVRGIIPTFFRYGDLQIQTAGKFQEFVFKQIPEPYETKEAIFKAQKEYRQKIREKDFQTREKYSQPNFDDELPTVNENGKNKVGDKAK